MSGKQMKARGKPKTGAEQSSEREGSGSKKPTVSYTRIEEMPILRPNDPAGLALWLEAGEVYFRKTYQVYGRFFPSGVKPKIDPPVRPRVRAPVNQDNAAEAGVAANEGAPRDDADSHSSSDGAISEDDSEDDMVDEVETEAQADAIFADEVKTYSKRKAREQELRPSMYADVRANLSAESVEKLSEQPKFLRYHQTDDPYGMLRLILKTHGGTRAGWSVTDSRDAQK